MLRYEPVDPFYLGNKIREERKIRRMTQKELSDKTGFCVRYICEVEKGRNKPCVDFLKAVCVEFEISADSLLGIK